MNDYEMALALYDAVEDMDHWDYIDTKTDNVDRLAHEIQTARAAGLDGLLAIMQTIID